MFIVDADQGHIFQPDFVRGSRVYAVVDVDDDDAGVLGLFQRGDQPNGIAGGDDNCINPFFDQPFDDLDLLFNCAGTGGVFRMDRQNVLDFVNSFLD